MNEISFDLEKSLCGLKCVFIVFRWISLGVYWYSVIFIDHNYSHWNICMMYCRSLSLLRTKRGLIVFKYHFFVLLFLLPPGTEGYEKVRFQFVCHFMEVGGWGGTPYSCQWSYPKCCPTSCFWGREYPLVLSLVLFKVLSKVLPGGTPTTTGGTSRPEQGYPLNPSQDMGQPLPQTREQVLATVRGVRLFRSHRRTFL